MDTKTKALEVLESNKDLFEREVRIQTILEVMRFRAENGNISNFAACKELNVDYNKFLRWIEEGVFTDYLRTRYHSEMAGISMQIMEEVSDVVRHQLDLASGKVYRRGVNPTSAAEFIFKILDRISPEDVPENTKNIQIDVNFTPVEYDIGIKNNSVAIASKTPADIVEGVVKEI
jgi:hypothetical protein